MTDLTFDVRDADPWAQEIFGRALLRDRRLGRRVVEVAADMARSTGSSLAAACGGDKAAVEGSYRLFRNPRVDPEVLARGAFEATAARVRTMAPTTTILAITDSTTGGYRHDVAEQMGDLGGKAGSKARGFWVHSDLLVAFDEERRKAGLTVGLAHQDFWIRDDATHGKKHKRKKRDYEDKESFKWQRSDAALAKLLGPELMRRVITVCDREADVYEYLHFKLASDHRFVVRASSDRSITDDEGERGRLFGLLDGAPVRGTLEIEVPQREGRRARRAKLEIRAMRVRLNRPARIPASEAPEHMGVNVVLAREIGAPSDQEPLQWMLLTNEAINTAEDVERVLAIYRVRWRIEEFHKAWKTGAGLERTRMQTPNAVLLWAVMTAQTAVRLMQLRELFDLGLDVPCDQVLEPLEWRALWIAVEKTRPPKVAPKGAWAMHALGRLGGWTDTKRTGNVGWETLWQGWTKLQERIQGYRELVSLGKDML